MSLYFTALEIATRVSIYLTPTPSAPPGLPDPNPTAPPGFEAVSVILSWAKWVGLIAAILALIAVAVTFMYNSRRGEGGEHVKTFVSILIGVMVIGAAAAIVGFISGS